jgi:hypothetical protein
VKTGKDETCSSQEKLDAEISPRTKNIKNTRFKLYKSTKAVA